MIPDSPITGPETSRRLSHPILLRGAFYAIGCAVTFGVITSLAKFTYDHGASPQTVVWSRILAAAVLLGGWHVLSSRKRKPLNTPVASEKISAALPVLVVAISVAVMGLGYLSSRYFIPVSLSALLFFTFPFVSQHNNAGEVFFFKPCTSGTTLRTAVSNGPTSVSCEPMCICSPRNRMLRILAARAYTPRTFSNAIPNLLS